MRLDKFLVESFLGTRKQVRLDIQSGKVKVNHKLSLDPAIDIHEEKDLIEFEDNLVVYPGRFYFMFHKPAGCITARSDEVHKTVFDYFEKPFKEGLFAVGRLDKDTEGLLFLTNDGDFDYHLMHPKHEVQKTYFFWALGILDETAIKKLEEGVVIGEQEELTKPAKLTIECSGDFKELRSTIPLMTEDSFPSICEGQQVVAGYLTITEGRKHQVKRMLKAVGCYVIYLKRVAISGVTLDAELKRGEYRPLSEEEITILYSKNTESQN